MAMPYQFNFPDMIRFFDDLKFVVQTGGVARIFQRGGEFPSLASILIAIIKFIVAVIFIYLVFLVIFGGYPRFFINIFTGSFYHKESMDPFIKENSLVTKTIKILLTNINTSGCMNVYTAFDSIYETTLANQLSIEIMDLKNRIESTYNKFKNDDDKYFEAIKDYYLYYNTVKVSDDYKVINTKTLMTTLNGDIPISNQLFYEQQLGYFVNNGLYTPGSKGNDEQIRDIYKIDKDANFKYFNSVAAIKILFLKISNIIRAMVQIIKNKPYLSFIVIPDSDKDTISFISTISNAGLSEKIVDGTIYNTTTDISSISKYTWHVIEYYQYKRDKEIYTKFENELNSAPIRWNKEEIITIRKYINTASDELRKKMQGSIFGRKLVKIQPQLIDPSRDASEQSYPENVRCNSEFFNFIERHPIFAHIYFSDAIPNPDNKNEFYKNVMKVYDRFYTNCNTSAKLPQTSSTSTTASSTTAATAATAASTDLTSKVMMASIMSNGNIFIKFVNAVNVFDLYLNEYKSKINKLYETQNYSQAEFFSRLFNPYFEDFVNNRIKVHFIKTFSQKTWTASYNKFLVQWAKLGQLLKTLMGSIAGSFNKSTNAKEPESVEV